MPQTLYDDNDPLDVMILSLEHLTVGCVFLQHGQLELNYGKDEEGEDAKILAVPTGDPTYNCFNELEDVAPHRILEIEEFFVIYKRLEPKVGKNSNAGKIQRKQKK